MSTNASVDLLCHCGEALNQSIVMPKDAIKSCPNCSVEDGNHVFYPYDVFGWRETRGYRWVQSWCKPCRLGEGTRRAAAALTCSDN